MIALIALNRLRLELDRRIYPLRIRQGELQGSELLTKLAGHVNRKLGFVPSNSKTELFQRYAAAHAQLEALLASTNVFLKSVSAAQLRVRRIGYCRRCGEKQELKKTGISRQYQCTKCQRIVGLPWRTHPAPELVPGTPLRTFSMLPPRKIPAFGVEFAAPRDAQQMFEDMSVPLMQASTDFTRELFDTLDEMVESQHAGLWKPVGATMGQYHFYTLEDETTVTGRRSETARSSWRVAGGTEHHERTTTRTDNRRTVRLSYHLHDVMDVEHHRINGEGVTKPDRVLPLLGNVPAVFKPFLEIISGTQVRELKWEKVVLDEEWTDTNVVSDRKWTVPDPVPVYRPDPAIVFCNHWVLAGW
jgi:hypothetical protein